MNKILLFICLLSIIISKTYSQNIRDAWVTDKDGVKILVSFEPGGEFINGYFGSTSMTIKIDDIRTIKYLGKLENTGGSHYNLEFEFRMKDNTVMNIKLYFDGGFNGKHKYGTASWRYENIRLIEFI